MKAWVAGQSISHPISHEPSAISHVADSRMLLAIIVGTVVATRKDPRLVSNKLLVVRPIDPRGKAEGNYLVAVDTVDAGVGETVLVVSGSSARMASGMKDCPVDAAIVGIVD